MAERIKIWYTADVIVPNGTDVWVYGDPCEKGCGADLVSGWINPGQSFDVHEERESVSCDEAPSDEELAEDEATLIAWVVDTIHDRIGWVDDNIGGHSFYAMGSDNTDYVTGRESSMCAHVHGATDDQLSEIWTAILAAQEAQRARWRTAVTI